MGDLGSLVFKEVLVLLDHVLGLLVRQDWRDDEDSFVSIPGHYACRKGGANLREMPVYHNSLTEDSSHRP